MCVTLSLCYLRVKNQVSCHIVNGTLIICQHYVRIRHYYRWEWLLLFTYGFIPSTSSSALYFDPVTCTNTCQFVWNITEGLLCVVFPTNISIVPSLGHYCPSLITMQISFAETKHSSHSSIFQTN